MYCLEKRLLLCKPGLLLLQIPTNSKPMGNSAVEEDLVWAADILQDHLSIMSLLHCEDLIRLCPACQISNVSHNPVEVLKLMLSPAAAIDKGP